MKSYETSKREWSHIRRDHKPDTTCPHNIVYSARSSGEKGQLSFLTTVDEFIWCCYSSLSNRTSKASALCQTFFATSEKMFEARIMQGSQLKKIIEAIRELVVDANLDCNDEGITMQVELEDPQLP